MDVIAGVEPVPRLLDTKICAGKVPWSVSLRRGFHEAFEPVESNRLNPVAERNFLLAGDDLDRRPQPQRNLNMWVNGRTRLSSRIHVPS